MICVYIKWTIKSVWLFDGLLLSKLR